MALEDLLDVTADVIDTHEDVTDGRVVTDDEIVAADVPMRIVWRSPREIAYAENGTTVVADADAVTFDPLTLGNELDCSDGRTYVVTGASRPRRQMAGVHHYTTPLRSLGD